MSKLFTYILVTLMAFGSLGQKKSRNTELGFLLEYLESSKVHTIEALSQVDDEMWNYTPKNGGWSIAECMDHIIVAESGVFDNLKKSLSEDPKEKESLKHRDGLIITFTSDRGKKAETPLPPPSSNLSRSESIKRIEQSRSEIINFLSDKSLDLRNHYGNAPFGKVDSYQLGLVIAAHGLRHTAQIKQVIAEYTGKPAEY